MPEVSDLWTTRDGEVMLRGVRCSECATVLFPPQRYGCEACGAVGEALDDIEIPGRGTISTFTTVHHDAAEPTPFQVGEIATEAAQFVRARLSIDAPHIGMPVVAILVGEADDQRLEFVEET